MNIAATNDGSELTARELLNSQKRLLYFHAPNAFPKTLSDCAGSSVIFEIDVAMTSDSKFGHVEAYEPYIGHPSKFYEMENTNFPSNNATLYEFRRYLLDPDNKSIKVLLDIKNEQVIPDVLALASVVGTNRCIAHAFISDWTIYSRGIKKEPHWGEEDLSLDVVAKQLQDKGIPLIANCRGFSNAHVEFHGLVKKMLDDAKKYTNIVALGLYYPVPEEPGKSETVDYNFLSAFNTAGYKAWINANTDPKREKYDRIDQWVGMCDDLDTVLEVNN